MFLSDKQYQAKLFVFEPSLSVAHILIFILSPSTSPAQIVDIQPSQTQAKLKLKKNYFEPSLWNLAQKYLALNLSLRFKK